MGDLEDLSGCQSHRLCEKWGGVKFSEQGGMPCWLHGLSDFCIAGKGDREV